MKAVRVVWKKVTIEITRTCVCLIRILYSCQDKITIRLYEWSCRHSWTLSKGHEQFN